MVAMHLRFLHYIHNIVLTKDIKPVKKAIVNELDEEDQNKNITLGIPLEGISSSKFIKSAEEMQKELKEIEDLIENTKQAQQQNKISADNWCVPFGKYKKLLGKSVLNIVGTDKKGNSTPTGRQYLAWMLNLDYLHQKDKIIISQLLS